MISVKSHQVSVTVRDQVAQTKTVQVIHNNTRQRLEYTYVFPLPAGAAVSNFSMLVNGKKQSGDLLSQEKAQGIYSEIVRQMKDPGILDYAEGGLFRVRVFPLEPNSDQRIELTYSQTLSYDSGMLKYVYPLAAGKSAGKAKQFTFSVQMDSKVPIKNVYSPTHTLAVSRSG